MSSIAVTAPIFRDEPDRQRFLETLGEACGKTGWQVHAWCLMENHFHLLLETPQANLVAGMKWFLGPWSSYGEYFKRRDGGRPGCGWVGSGARWVSGRRR